MGMLVFMARLEVAWEQDRQQLGLVAAFLYLVLTAFMTLAVIMGVCQVT
jgi:hypothetical protein